MRIPSGVTDQVVYFIAVDATDSVTRETGLSSFTVYRSRNGSTPAVMTTPTVSEMDSANMPGVYSLLLDEDMTVGAGNLSEEMIFHITHAGMQPVTRTIELYAPTNSDVTAIKAVTDNLPNSGALSSLATASALSTVDTVVDSILVGVNDVKGGTFNGATDSLEAIRDRGDAAWVTGGAGSAPTVEQIRAEIDSNSTQLAAILTDTGTTIPALIAALNNISSNDILNTALTESYAADGSAPTLSQSLLLIQQILGESAISGTALTVKRLDGSTTAATFTLDDYDKPRSITRTG